MDSATGSTSRGKTILLYGPSGIGKSTALKYINDKRPDFSCAPLDRLAKELGRVRGVIGPDNGVRDLLARLGANGFLSIGIEAAEQYDAKNPDSHRLIDVGAGFFDGTGFMDWLLGHESVVLMADPEVAYERSQKRPQVKRSLEEYRGQEFSPKRLQIYEQAKHRVDASCDKDELGRRLLGVVEQILR